MSGKWTVSRIRACRETFAAVTAYDYLTGRLADRAGLPLILVGDSLGMTVLGYADTLPVTMADMLHHTAAVVRGVTQALVVGDMPFLSYQVSEDEALRNGGLFLKQAGADAVKLEGGAFRAPLIHRMVENGIPVMGHLGLTPQSVKAMGGYRVQGRTDEEARRLLADARALEDAGVFCMVLEGMPAEVARQITESVRVPTIGIGAGPHCRAQILVMADLLGLFDDFKPKFVKRYAELAREMELALKTYSAEVREGRFPAAEHGY